MLNCMNRRLFKVKLFFIEGIPGLNFKTFFMTIFLVIFGIILGFYFKDKKYVKYDILRENIEAKKKEVITYFLVFLAGISIGLMIMLIFRSGSISILIEWISSIGTWAAVVVSLWLATGRKSRLKVNHGQDIVKLKRKEICFVAYNLSDKSLSLEFYGVKKPDDEMYSRPCDLKPEVVNAGEFQTKSLELDFIQSSLNINDSYEGDIISCFAEPDGRLHCEVISWKEEMSKFKKLNQNIKAMH